LQLIQLLLLTQLLLLLIQLLLILLRLLSNLAKAKKTESPRVIPDFLIFIGFLFLYKYGSRRSVERNQISKNIGQK
ncbi:MAG TPA: hypothetical protein PLB70_07820, partial [Paludibacteraceae bacterium]|nr:hypothetical protein [Paludibacteraceae bacterium]